MGGTRSRLGLGSGADGVLCGSSGDLLVMFIKSVGLYPRHFAS